MSDHKEKQTKVTENSQPKPKKRKIYLFFLIPISLIILTGFTYGFHLYTKAQNTIENSYEAIDRTNDISTLRIDEVDPVEDNVSILIIGIDESVERAKEKYSRSDTLILATFNKKLGNVKLLSIPRDSYVYVPEVDYHTKINHAHFFGGPLAAIETIETFLNIPIDYYVQLNFNAFIEVVDAVDGIYFDVPFDMSEINTKGQENKIKIAKGYQKLDGEKALALARSRKYDSDIKRGERQQEIIKSIANKVTSASSVLKLDDLIDAVGNNMKTNLTFSDMTAFLSYGMNKNVQIDTVNFEGSGGIMDDNLWYFQVDEDSRNNIENTLRQHLDLPIENPLHKKDNSSGHSPIY